MKKSKILTSLCIGVLSIASLFTFAGCNDHNDFNINAKEVYAISALSSVNYLVSKEVQSNSIMSVSQINSEEELVMKNCLTMFDDIVQGGKVEQTTIKNTEEEFADYHFVMNITTPSSQESVKLYYNEIETQTEVEIEDEKEEVEVSITLHGLLVVGQMKFDVEGKREFESEGDETESSIEMTTKSKTNNKNYVTIKQSVEYENGEYELEYEYKIYENEKLIQDTETEIEIENNKIELEYQIKTNEVLNETVYKITKGEVENTFDIYRTTGHEIVKIVATKTSTGYQLVLANNNV